MNDIQPLCTSIAQALRLGNPTCPVKSVSGGYMHKMVCLQTDMGKYAIKMLNPTIMKRADAHANFAAAEELEKLLEENQLPIVPALTFGGKKMQQITMNQLDAPHAQMQYYYVFEWTEARALSSKDVQKEHCEIIGETLAKIHRIKQSKEPSTRSRIEVDWDRYIRLADIKHIEIAPMLAKNRVLLYHSQNQGNAALAKLPNRTSICNGDMDCKNVLWEKGKPQIIDLESLSYGNPYMDMFELALCWSGYEHCAINAEFLLAFIKAYSRECKDFKPDWEVLYETNCGRLEWLEYNVKRALMIECESEEERQLGIRQVVETLEHVVYYHSVRDELLMKLQAVQ